MIRFIICNVWTSNSYTPIKTIHTQERTNYIHNAYKENAQVENVH